MGRLTRLLCVFATLAVLISACGGGEGDTEGTDTNTKAGQESPTQVGEETRNLTSGEPANYHDERNVAGEDSLELELDDNYFEPTVIIGRAGQDLTLELFNEGGNIHNFSLPGQNVSQDLQQDERKEVEVRIPDSGAVTFFCSYHAEFGMRGELRVS